MSYSLQEISINLDRATRGSEIFGPQKHAAKNYKLLASICHPDVNEDRVLAEEVFKKLGKWWEEAQLEMEDGKYNDPDYVGKTTTITTKTKTYQVGKLFSIGDISDVYSGFDGGKKILVKVALDPIQNQRLQNESTILKALRAKDTDVGWNKYLPNILDSFLLNGLRVNIFEYTEGLYTLKQVEKEYPNGVHPRAFTWMWNRILEILGWIHSNDIVHANFWPTNLLINPETHGLVVIDWTNAGPAGKIVNTTPYEYRNSVPPEMLYKKGVTPGTDLYMAAMSMALLSKQVGGSLKGFLNACVINNLVYREQDAWAMRKRFDSLQEALFGPKKFVPFTMKGDV